ERETGAADVIVRVVTAESELGVRVAESRALVLERSAYAHRRTHARSLPRRVELRQRAQEREPRMERLHLTESGHALELLEQIFARRDAHAVARPPRDARERGRAVEAVVEAPAHAVVRGVERRAVVVFVAERTARALVAEV